MSDFPHAGNIENTRSWLDKEGFVDVLIDCEADILIRLSKGDILFLVPRVNGLKLWGFLNTARGIFFV